MELYAKFLRIQRIELKIGGQLYASKPKPEPKLNM